jgi:hypothetical protein
MAEIYQGRNRLRNKRLQNLRKQNILQKQAIHPGKHRTKNADYIQNT